MAHTTPETIPLQLSRLWDTHHAPACCCRAPYARISLTAVQGQSSPGLPDNGCLLGPLSFSDQPLGLLAWIGSWARLPGTAAIEAPVGGALPMVKPYQW